MIDAEDVLQAHTRKRRAEGGKGMSEAESDRHRRRLKCLVWLAIAQGIVLPILCFTLAFALASHPCDPADASCTRETNMTSYLFMIPGGASLVILAMVLYNQRGPAGLFEHSGAPLGCLPRTAVQPEEEA